MFVEEEARGLEVKSIHTSYHFLFIKRKSYIYTGKFSQKPPKTSDSIGENDNIFLFNHAIEIKQHKLYCILVGKKEKKTLKLN